MATYNGDRTLKTCLESLQKLNYPDYEVILVDDGSSDSTPQIAITFPKFQYVRHETNLGLSAARNTGIRTAQGEVIAFTDSDCRADEDWLYYLVNDLTDSGIVGIGAGSLAARGFIVGSGGDGLTRTTRTRHAHRHPGRAHSRLQHGFLQMGADGN